MRDVRFIRYTTNTSTLSKCRTKLHSNLRNSNLHEYLSSIVKVHVNLSSNCQGALYGYGHT